MKKKKDDVIKNWSVFGVDGVMLNVHEIEVDGETRYNPVIAIFLNDYEGKEEEKVINLTTDHFCTDPKHAIFETAMGLSKLFANINSEVNRWDDKGEIVETYDLNEDFDDYIDEDDDDDEDDVKVKEVKRVIH